MMLKNNIKLFIASFCTITPYKGIQLLKWKQDQKENLRVLNQYISIIISLCILRSINYSEVVAIRTCYYFVGQFFWSDSRIQLIPLINGVPVTLEMCWECVVRTYCCKVIITTIHHILIFREYSMWSLQDQFL